MKFFDTKPSHVDDADDMQSAATLEATPRAAGTMAPDTLRTPAAGSNDIAYQDDEQVIDQTIPEARWDDDRATDLSRRPTAQAGSPATKP